MKTRSVFLLTAILSLCAFTTTACKAAESPTSSSVNQTSAVPTQDKTVTEVTKEKEVLVGAQRTDKYLPLLKDKRVGLYSNHTGINSEGVHTLDVLLGNGVEVSCVFSPEHGFRGTADAGEKVSSSVDPETGVNIVSLYGKGVADAMQKAMEDVDVVVVDIQDVGLRFYTYYCTMLELMNSAKKNGKQVLVLDRPNPNGMSIDGPILDMQYASGVGRLPIPILHGLTLGEMALMINGEGWLKDGGKVDLTVVPCDNYTHQSRYRLPKAPSPNLPNMTSIYLYPSLCYFEATNVSLGRGTDKPFQIYGHPLMTGRDFSFTPESRPGAKNPPQKDVLCYGVDLSGMGDEEIIAMGINLEYLIDAYRNVRDTSMSSTETNGEFDPNKFFTAFFEKLIGNGEIRNMIISGMTADEIKATWKDDVEAFKIQRRPYLLYEE